MDDPAQEVVPFRNDGFRQRILGEFLRREGVHIQHGQPTAGVHRGGHVVDRGVVVHRDRDLSLLREDRQGVLRLGEVDGVGLGLVRLSGVVVGQSELRTADGVPGQGGGRIGTEIMDPEAFPGAAGERNVSRFAQGIDPLIFAGLEAYEIQLPDGQIIDLVVALRDFDLRGKLRPAAAEELQLSRDPGLRRTRDPVGFDGIDIARVLVPETDVDAELRAVRHAVEEGAAGVADGEALLRVIFHRNGPGIVHQGKVHSFALIVTDLSRIPGLEIEVGAVSGLRLQPGRERDLTAAQRNQLGPGLRLRRELRQR